ncbi:MAG: PH domain-containing protein [Eggerthellaceae bacterium]|nr:PH domain-containing protein [Eggerthellaceae bacterium]
MQLNEQQNELQDVPLTHFSEALPENPNLDENESEERPATHSPFRATFQTGRHYKVHKSYIWVAPIVAFFAVVFLTLINGMQGWVELAMAIQRGDIAVNPLLVIGVAVLSVVVFAGLLVGLYALAWKNMSYVFDEREFSYYSGIITKRRVHVPYARVQSVNHRASIIQRVFGVCTVTIDSAGGSSNKGVRVPYLRLETAERLRAELFMRKAAVAVGVENALVYVPEADTDSPEGMRAEASRVAQQRAQAPVAPGAPVPPVAPAAAAVPSMWVCPQCGATNSVNFCGNCGTPAPAATQANALDTTMGVVGDWRGVYGGAESFGEEPVTHEFGLSNHELLLTTISHDTPLSVALIVGLSMVVTFALVLLVQDEVAVTLARIAFPIVVGITVVSWAFGLLTVLFSYGNFRARRRGSRIEVERGLLAREFSGIDIERVQSVEIRQSLIRRLIGYCEVSLGRIDAAGEQNKGNNNSKANTKGLVIHPFVKVDRVDEIIDGLAPELTDRPRRSECVQLPKPALRRALLRRCLWFNWVLWAGVAIGVLWGVLAVLENTGAIRFASTSAHAQYDSFMTGSLVLVIVVCAAITIGRGVGAVLWSRHSGYTWNRKYALVHNDGLSTETSIIPRQKIQSASTRSNPFQRRLSLVTLRAITAAGTRSTTTRLIDVPAEVGDAYLDWLKPQPR